MGSLRITVARDTTAPTVPTGLTATPVSQSEIDLAWSASVDTESGVAGYRIFRDGTQLTQQTTRTFADTGLAAGSQHSYQVSAFDVTGNESALCAAVNATTQSAGGTTFDFYISPTGSDAAAGTVAAPWAITSLRDTNPNNARIAGKRIGLLPGTYNLNALQSGSNPNRYEYPILHLPAGTAQSPTYLGSSAAGGTYSPRTATLYIDATNTTGNFVLGQNHQGAGYYTIDGIVIDAGGVGTTTVGFSGGLIAVYTAATNGGVTIKNCEFKNVYTATAFGNNYAVVNLSQGEGGPPIGTVITNNYFHNIYRSNQNMHTHAILSLGAVAPQITYNSFVNCNEHIDFKYSTANAVVAWNYFGPTYEALALRGFDGNNLTQPNVANAIHHNVFDGCGSTIAVDTQTYFGQNHLFYNNTVYDARTAGSVSLFVERMTAGNSSTIYNNIFVSLAASGGYTGNFGAQVGQTLIDYNCFGFASGSQGWGTFNGSSYTLYGSLAAWKAGSGYDAHSIGGNASYPQFASAITVGNGPAQYQLASTSPCRGAGQSGGDLGAWAGVSAIGCDFMPVVFDYYISPTGSDANAGSLSAPWAITALNTKQGVYGGLGKRIGLLAGTYNVQALAASRGSGAGGYSAWVLDVDGGTAANGPTVVASCDVTGSYSRGAATLTQKIGSIYGNPNNNNGSGNARAGNPTIGQSDSVAHLGYVMIDGLVLTGNISAGCQFGVFSGASHPAIIVKNCEFYDNNGVGSEVGDNLCCLSINVCPGALIQNNYFHDCVGYAAASANHLSAIIQWTGAHDTTIEFNTAINCGGLYGKESTQNGGTLRYNYVDVTAFTSGDTAFSPISDFAEGANANVKSIYGNILIGMHPLAGLANLGGGTTSPFEIYNNTIIIARNAGAADYYGIGTSVNSPGTVKQYNNIVHNQSGGAMNEGYALHTAATLSTVDYNVYCKGAGADRWTSWTNQGGGTAYSSLAAWRTATGREANSTVAASDPLFTGVGSAATKYQLQASSVAKNFGHIGGVSGGASLDAGAWGLATFNGVSVGCSFGPQ